MSRRRSAGQSFRRRITVVVPAVLLVAAGLAPAQAASTSATITGGTVVAGQMYAKSGAAITVVVNTAGGVKCVALQDEPTQVDGNSPPSWTFAFGARPVEGLVTKQVRTGNGNNSNCTSSAAERSVSYVVDNTGPTLTPTVSPTPNAAGWNSSSVTVSWDATDPSVGGGVPGSGVVGSPSDNVFTGNGTHTATAIFADRLGNSTTASVTVRIDDQGPSIVGSRSPAANGSGWNNMPVAVSFACADSGSGVKSCTGSQTVSTDGADQSVTGQAVDNAGNTSQAAVDGISIDSVLPTLSGAATTAPNDAGWYRDDVTIRWTAADALSGVDPATVPADAVLTGEGVAVSTAASVADRASNSRSASSAPVKIDRTAPTTAAVAPGEWTNTDATVTLDATDGLSGVAATHYRVDGGPTRDGTSLVLDTEGVHDVEYWSVDRAGNEETHRTVSVKVDKTAPGITHASSPAANPSGWHRTPVTVTFTCADGLSGVAACTPPVDVVTQGAAQDVTGTATDEAGNSATAHATLNVDRTDPGISATVDRPANGNNWYDGNVLVSFDCSDELSGIDTCPVPTTLDEGADQSVSGEAVDVAGNTHSTSLHGINIDKTAPELSGRPTSEPNANGWHDGSVTVAWTCSDPLSGIAGPCPADSVVSGEGGNLGALASVTDRAGNVRSAALDGIRIDTTAPSTTVEVPDPLATGWYDGPVAVTLTGLDALSGVDETYYQVDGGHPQVYAGTFDFGQGGTHTITFWSKDNAGNVEDNESPDHTVTLQIDDVAPVIQGSRAPAGNAFGWNNTDVIVSFDCSDAQSAIAECTPDRVVDTEGADQSVTGHAEDAAGNTASDTVEGISVDKTRPTLEGTALEEATTYGWHNGDVTVHWTAADALSGIDAATTPSDTTVTGEGAALEAGPVSVSDLAGNTRTAAVSPIRIDRTAPSLSGEPTTAANGFGWYDAPVTVQWTASDELAGLDPSTVPGDSVLDEEGDNQAASASVSDKAGNTTQASVEGIRIDTTDPQTAVSAPSGWVNQSATVTLIAGDNLSGVDKTYHQVDGADPLTGDSIEFGTEGVYEVEVWSTDKAGNEETHKTFTVRIDKTNPTIDHTLDPEANAAGWNNADVTVTFHCEDALSGIASCTDPIPVTMEGVAQPFPGAAADNAGNTATDPATVSLDKTDPTITGGPDRAPNAFGWYRDDVTVSFACADSLSGVTSCTPASTTLSEGADQHVTGTAVDAADNDAVRTVVDIDVDETDPTIAGQATTEPNSAGWYRDDVVVRWSCADKLSGIDDGACPHATRVADEGDDLSAVGTVEDRAGNDASATVAEIRIDRTAPSTVLDVAAPTAAGWYADSVQVTLTTAPDLSGVTGTFYRIDGGDPQAYTGSFAFTQGGVHTLTWWSTDAAGNLEDGEAAGNSRTLRIDDGAPTIVASRVPADGNSRGWNNEPVTVHFECADAQSGVVTCPPDVSVAADAADQEVIGTVVDNTGHAASTTLGGIDVDLTSPSLSGTPVETANEAGWYRDDVRVRWTCSDATSGIRGDCPDDSTIGGEGADLGATATVTDNADNLTAASVTGIKIDRTAPVTSLTAPNTWVNDSVAVTLSALDGLSGPRVTHYRINGGDTRDGLEFHLDDEGAYVISYWSVDHAGNVEPTRTATVRIDKTDPWITHTQAPLKNGNGWNNTDVTVTFECGDGASGVQFCSEPTTLADEGSGQTVAGEARDHAGNTASDTAVVDIDKTAPTVSAAADRHPNGAGWYADNVTVTFTCNDNLSGTDCPTPIVLSQGEDQVARGSATDLAGNSTQTQIDDIDVDKTAPAITGAPTTDANGAGWYRGDVVVRWTCDDALSGLGEDCPGDSTISGSGRDLSASAQVRDRAGNQATGTVPGIDIDRVDPLTTVTVPAAYSTGWHDGPIPVTLAATDDLSGVRTTFYSVDGGAPTAYDGTFQYADPGIHTLTFWSVDDAGNTEDKSSGGNSVVLRIDDRKPTIKGAATTSPNGAGWFKDPVQVSFTCADGETAIADCGPDATLTGNGADQSVTGTARDAAGNTETATVGGINIDRQLPNVTIDHVEDGRAYTLGAVPAPSCSASDAVSGLTGPCTGTLTGGTSNGVGSYTYTATASDKAGNTRTVTASYRVTYDWDGFLQPIYDTAHQTGSTTSSFKAGSTVPVKFVLTNASGATVQPTIAPQWITPVRGSAVTTAPGSISYPDPVTVGGSYSYQGDKWQFNWASPKSGAGYHWRIGARLDDGTVRWVNLALR